MSCVPCIAHIHGGDSVTLVACVMAVGVLLVLRDNCYCAGSVERRRVGVRKQQALQVSEGASVHSVFHAAGLRKTMHKGGECFDELTGA